MLGLDRRFDEAIMLVLSKVSKKFFPLYGFAPSMLLFSVYYMKL